jgi:cell division protein FtsI (penicillin-binding protein 3)
MINTHEKKRAVLLTFFCLFLFFLLIIQFYRIQIIQGKEWKQKAENQHRKFLIEPFARGTFYSNPTVKLGHPEKAQPFAIDVPMFHLYIDPERIPKEDKKSIAQALIQLISIPKEEEKEFIQEFYKDSRSRKLMMWLDQESKTTILSWWYQYIKDKKIPRNALYFVSDFQRSYPFGYSLGQVLHTIRNVKDEKTKQGVPTGGLELQFNEILKGKLGKRWILRSPKSHLASGKLVSAPKNGADIYLTINHYLQAITENELEKGVKRFKAKGAWAVMMDPFTGEILSIAQYPFFNPAEYQQFFNDPEKIKDTRVNAVSYAFEPGSTMKPITLAIALTANLLNQKNGLLPIFSPEEKIATSKGWFPGRSRPIQDTRVHRYLNMDLAMQKSSNIYMASIIKRVLEQYGNEWYREQLTETFGFGKRTHLELPGETPGLVPQPGKLYPSGALEWSIPTPYSLAMGYNIQVNSIQLLRAFSTLANGGYLVSPTLVREITENQSDGKKHILLKQTNKQKLEHFPKVLDTAIVERVVKSMKFVTKRGGAATKAEISGFTEAGKTGTSRKIVNGAYSKKKYFSSFVGFAPTSHPRFVLFVGVDEPDTTFIPGYGQAYYGSQSAAPIFQQIATRTLEYLGVTPDDPYGYPKGDPRSDPEKADWTSEVKNLEQLYIKWNTVTR